MVQSAYQNYLNEKKIYNQELEEETRRRLQQIRLQKQPENQEASESKAPIVSNETQTTEATRPGLKQKIFYYLTLGYKKY